MRRYSYLVLACLLACIVAQDLCPGHQISPKCTEAMSQIFADVYREKKNITAAVETNITTNFLGFSGRFVNDFGEYQACQDSARSHYLTLYFNASVMGTSVDVLFGYCAPKECSAEDSYANATGVFNIFSRGVFNLSLLTNKPCEVNFYDPNEPELGSSGMTIGIAIALSAIASLTVMGTLMNAYFDIKDSLREKRSKIDAERLLGDVTQASSDNQAQSPPKPRKRNLRGFLRFIDCFDARKNFLRIVTVKYTDHYDFNLEIFNGLRVFYFLYVVYGHTYMMGTNYIDNLADLPDYAQGWWLLIVFAALYAVDAFFFMSGFFFAFIALSKLQKMRPSPKNYMVLAFHRLFRIWPAYIFAILFFWRILPLMGSGPVWFQMTDTTSLCENGKVLQNLFFVDDFLVESQNYCYGWGWYLSNDFQMFLMTPFFLWWYIKNRKAAKLGIWALIGISTVLALIIGYNLRVRVSPPTTGGITNPKGFSQYYVKPYIRLPPYFIGVLVGLFYREYKEKYGTAYRIGTLCRRSPWKYVIPAVGFAVMMLIILLIRQVQTNPDNWSDLTHAIYKAFQRTIYVICMTMIILPGLLGEDTYVKRFLSHPLLVPLARIGFTAYLVHLFWIYRNYYDETAAFHFSTETVLLNTLANSVIAFATAFILSLLAEVPLANIESVYIFAKKPARGPRPSKGAANNAEQPKAVSGEGKEPAKQNNDEAKVEVRSE